MQIFANLLVALSVFRVAMATPDKYPAAMLVERQSDALANVPAGPDPCLDYSMTANMSIISATPSYRTVFIQKANVGTIATARMLNAAQAKLPALTADAALNQQCGNLTTVAITEAEKNFTQGIVAQFTTAGLPVGIKSGPEVIVVVATICALFSMVWVFAS